MPVRVGLQFLDMRAGVLGGRSVGCFNAVQSELVWRRKRVAPASRWS